MLDEFGRFDIRDQDRGDEGIVAPAHQVEGLFVVGAKDDAVGVEEVINGAAFAEKLRVGSNAELNAGGSIATHCVTDLLSGFDGDGGFVDDDPVAVFRLK